MYLANLRRPEAAATQPGELTVTGTIIWRPAAAAPGGFLFADGSTLSRITYSDLFAVIGEAFGAGDGSTTFQIPDLRGEFLRGWDAGRGLDVGRAIGAWQADQLQGHWHESLARVNATAFSGSLYSAQGNGGTDDTFLATVRNPATGEHGSVRFGAETRSRNVAIAAFIKY